METLLFRLSSSDKVRLVVGEGKVGEADTGECSLALEDLPSAAVIAAAEAEEVGGCCCLFALEFPLGLFPILPIPRENKRLL